MKSAKFRLPVVIAAALVLSACAPKREDAEAAAAPLETAPAADPATVAMLKQKLRKYLPDVAEEDIKPSVVNGLYEVQDGMNFGYVTPDGRYLIAGELTDLDAGVNLTDDRRKAQRVALLDELGEDQMIIFAPKNGAKHVVTVFTDIDCGYCRKLHNEMARYNDAGIEIRYLAFPRAGPNSNSFRKAEMVWCAADRQQALTDAKNGEAMEGKPNCESPVAREWTLGAEIGVRGTPMLVLEDGSVINGYVPAEALAQHLEMSEQAKAALPRPRQG